MDCAALQTCDIYVASLVRITGEVRKQFVDMYRTSRYCSSSQAWRESLITGRQDEYSRRVSAEYWRFSGNDLAVPEKKMSRKCPEYGTVIRKFSNSSQVNVVAQKCRLYSLVMAHCIILDTNADEMI